MNCADVTPLVEAYFDGEIDLVRHLEIENHLKSCASCEKRLEDLRQMHATLDAAHLRFTAPESLQRWAAAQGRKLEVQAAGNSWSRLLMWPSLALAALALFVVGTPFYLHRSTSRNQADEIVAAHVRSLMAAHLTDVPSSDQHTVKPWFSGKIDFAPAVRDFSEFKFPLIGGRLDYVADRAVAVLIYRRDQHYINLFIWPSPTKRDSGPEDLVRRGYNLVHWTHGGMTYWAISDLNSHELDQFSQIVQTQST